MRRVVEVGLDRRGGAAETAGDLRDRQALRFAEVARQRHRPATLDHTVIRRRRSIGGHASRYCEPRRRPRCRRRRILHLPRRRMPLPAPPGRNDGTPARGGFACTRAVGSRPRVGDRSLRNAQSRRPSANSSAASTTDLRGCAWSPLRWRATRHRARSKRQCATLRPDAQAPRFGGSRLSEPRDSYELKRSCRPMTTAWLRLSGRSHVTRAPRWPFGQGCSSPSTAGPRGRVSSNSGARSATGSPGQSSCGAFVSARDRAHSAGRGGSQARAAARAGAGQRAAGARRGRVSGLRRPCRVHARAGSWNFR